MNFCLLLFLLLLVNLVAFSQQSDPNSKFSYSCTTLLPAPDSSTRNFVYQTPTIEPLGGFEITLDHNVHVDYYCSPQLYDYNSQSCEEFANENILDNYFQPNKVCTSTQRIGILGLQLSITLPEPSTFGDYFFSFNFMTLGIPKTTPEEPYILIDFQDQSSLSPNGFNSTVPIDVTLNFQRGTPSDFLITLSHITMMIAPLPGDSSFSLYCDSHEIVSYVSSSPQSFGCNEIDLAFCNDFFPSIVPSRPTYIPTTHCRTGGRFQIVAKNGVFTTIRATIEPIINLIRMESYFNGQMTITQSPVYLRNQGGEIKVESLRVSASNITPIDQPIFPNHWYTFTAFVDSVGQEDTLIFTITSDEGSISQNTLSYSNLFATEFQFDIGGVNGFIDDIQFGIVPLSTTSLPVNPVQQSLTTEKAETCDPFFYFPCNSV